MRSISSAQPPSAKLPSAQPPSFNQFTIYSFNHQFIMKKTLLIFSTILALAFGLSFMTGCGESTHSHEDEADSGKVENVEKTTPPDTETPSDSQGYEFTAKYVCPMHCEGSGSDVAGNCPVCGMEYVLNEDFEGDGGHDHDDHEGHSH
jgi:hypothetical protein